MTRLLMRLRFLIMAWLVLLAFLVGFSAPADAASIVMCRGAAVATATGPARFVAASSGTAYSLDNNGCATFALADIGDAAAQGFAQSGPVRAIVFNVGVATGTTDFIIGNIPASAALTGIYWSNSVAAAVTGGVSLGTTANGVDIVAAQACASTCLTFTTDALTLKRVFSLTAATPIHAAAVTAWNSTNVTITMTYSYF